MEQRLNKTETHGHLTAYRMTGSDPRIRDSQRHAHDKDLRTFNRLPLDEKTNYMWDHGNCISQRMVENRYILCIFEINGFYVEAIYSKQNNRVNAILPIMGMESWEAYVDQVIRNVTEVN